MCALAASVQLAMLGKNLAGLADLNMQKAHYACDRIASLDDYELVFKRPFYNEFVIRCRDSAKVSSDLLKNGIAGGLDLGGSYPELHDCLLFCVTEVVSREDMDRLVDILEGVK